jgi:hypothetical protein
MLDTPTEVCSSHSLSNKPIVLSTGGGPGGRSFGYLGGKNSVRQLRARLQRYLGEMRKIQHRTEF